MIFPFWRYVRPTEIKTTHHQTSIPLCPYSILLYPYHIPIISHCIRSPQQCGLNTFRKKPLSVATLFGELFKKKCFSICWHNIPWILPLKPTRNTP